ncbi:bifunctional biotin operon repressor/biotin--[acetyl-CoA-carboxylase] ligase [Conservatibacter flavescens]|uniref:biotin--[biotin carboxyl-carrier protein] ligase n=2 Tax=Conservatibacter flavescens TaxID=28161 RepID=A0A2M8S3U2_9PAST|nr:bifunctional biotin operon repressor/biotin--[acetyl-CoA-carboxylase] ligase [Conservatibacter flavescens]
MQALNSQYLSTALSPYNLFIFEKIDSTNQYLLDNIATLKKGDICLAEQQTAGRGRRGRPWQSPFGSQIIMSLYWQWDPKKSLEGLSTIVGLAIVETLRKAGAWVEVKWPNDILLNKRKLAGILVEIANHKNNAINLVIGVGLNLALPTDNTPIDQAWANLNEAIPNYDRNKLTVQLIQNIYHYLAIFEQEGISPAIQQEWIHADAFFGEEVTILSEQHTIIGIEQGIDEKGYIRIATENGLACFSGGEVSLRWNKT